MKIFFTFISDEISISSYMEISICPSDNDIKLSKYGMSGCYGDYFIKLGRQIDHLCLVARQPSMIRSISDLF